MSRVPIRNVYNMLVYAFEVLKSKEYARLNYEECDDIYDLLASLLLCGTKTLIKRGLLRNYINKTEELSVIKGRVDIGMSVRKLSIHNAKAMCTFDDFDSNIQFNQVIKTTLLYLQQRVLSKTIKQDISKTLLFFKHIDIININTINWNSFVFNKSNAHYDTLLYFCRLICDDAVANQDKGKNNFRIIEDKLLPVLFEKFVFNFYKKHLDCFVGYQKQIKWKSDNFTMLPRMSTDIIIENERLKIILDTKFYSKTLQGNRFNDNQTVISSNIYQIFAYVKNEDTANGKVISGMLLYPEVDDNINIKYNIDNHMFYVNTINLNENFENIKHELIKIMKHSLEI